MDIPHHNILIVCLLVCGERRSKLVQGAGREFVGSSGLWPLRVNRRWEPGSGKLMAIAGENNDAGTSCTGVPHSLKDLLSLSEETTPGVLDIDGPVLGERDRRSNELPSNTLGNRTGEPGQQISQLLLAQHGLICSVEWRVVAGAVAASIHHEKAGWSLSELVPGGIASEIEGTSGFRDRRVDISLVKVPRVHSSAVDTSCVGRPIV